MMHWNIENWVYIVLIRSYVIWTFPKHFSYLKNSWGFGKFCPKFFGNMGQCIDPNSIKLIFLNQIIYPLEQILLDKLVLLSEIWQSWKSAVFNLPLVFPVFDLTLGMVVFWLIKWVYLSEIICVPNMIWNNINQNKNIPLVGSLYQWCQVLLGSKVLIQRFKVYLPVSMVSMAKVFVFL